MSTVTNDSYSSQYRELLLGCGSRREKCLQLPTSAEIGYMRAKNLDYLPSFNGPMSAANVQRPGTKFDNLTTLDINTRHAPDIQFNLERIDGEVHNRIPNRNMQDGRVISTGYCPDNYYDEIHAYEVLEHIGRQGDYRKFFDQFTEFWRILKPGGFLFATVPSWSSEWAWGDPSHTRVITPGTLVFLSQRQYEVQVGVTPMSDFRWCYGADFETVFTQDDGNSHGFVLEVVK